MYAFFPVLLKDICLIHVIQKTATSLIYFQNVELLLESFNTVLLTCIISCQEIVFVAVLRQILLGHEYILWFKLHSPKGVKTETNIGCINKYTLLCQWSSSRLCIKITNKPESNISHSENWSYSQIHSSELSACAERGFCCVSGLSASTPCRQGLQESSSYKC